MQMKEITQCSINTKPRMTLGYLDEHAYDEFHNHVLAGIYEAARMHNVNIIRFGHYEAASILKSDSLMKTVLEHILQYDLDGLMFLGWSRAASYSGFREMFKAVPLFSIGTGFNDIPHTYFPGDESMREIVRHLVQIHKYKRIAFIEPRENDARTNIYLEMMKEYQIYNPELFIDKSQLVGFDVPVRGKKAVSILLDDRMLQFDAIISLYNPESNGLIKELKERGIRIPEDIAVTSYDNGDVAKYSSPTLTTVNFPYWELGYVSCEKLVELLRSGSVKTSNLVPGRVIIRESCGCMSESVRRSFSGSIPDGNIRYGDLTPIEIRSLFTKDGREAEYCNVDLNALLGSLHSDFENMVSGNPNGKSSNFIWELDKQLRLIEDSRTFSEMEGLAACFRKTLLPFFVKYLKERSDIYLWFEDLLQQTQIMLLDKKEGIWAREEIKVSTAHIALQFLSQKLLDNFNKASLIQSLEENLWEVGVPSCFIFIFIDGEDMDNLFTNCELAFEYRNNSCIVRDNKDACSARQMLSEILFHENRPYLMIAQLLYVDKEPIGFALFEPGPLDERIYSTLATHISTALNGALLLEKLDSSYKRLVEQAHKKGMADVASGVLHNVANILNSIYISMHMIRDLVSNSPVRDMTIANDLLKKHLEHIEEFIVNHEKGKKLMQFYPKINQSMNNYRNHLLNHVNRLIYNISLIEGIVASQSNYTGIKQYRDELDIVMLIEDALLMNSVLLQKRHVKIVRDYSADLSKTFVQKTKLLHVLVNIVKNAVDAMADMPEDKRVLSISVSQNDQDKFIRVTDSGHGIPQELLESIFEYGFTTKKGGHGFGLHSCVSYMAEMGGKIWAESEGTGKGTTFTLKIRS